MKKLNAIRDELAEKYYNEQLENGELNSRHMDFLDMSFSAGFDAGVSELMPLITRMITSLEIYAMTNESFPEYGNAARETLAEVEKILGDL